MGFGVWGLGLRFEVWVVGFRGDVFRGYIDNLGGGVELMVVVAIK